MARSIKESEQAITSALSAIETSLANKEVSASNLKVSEVADKIREIELGPKGVFGFKVNNLESDPTNRVTYIDDNKKMTPVTVNLSDGSVDYGDWKDTWLLEKIYPVMLKTNGTIAYKLDPNDQTKKASGGTSDINNMDYFLSNIKVLN